ncbi:hypothetical protein [Paenibacillus cymbidii]|uniref:hypothetical protein n=1 Tax=Paenibacillus cymbidii TaxID=1639034 RepID=UPI001081D9F5|nr:hypothetical protein [Paenibacillus cymbidii]
MKRELIRPIKLPFIRGNTIGYLLCPAGAKEAAFADGDYRTFQSRVWGQMPIQLEHSYGTNAFFIRSIGDSLSRSHEGWVEWLGTRYAEERYARLGDKGKKQMPLRPDGMGTFQLPNGQRLIVYLE